MEIEFAKYHGLGNDFILVKENSNINYIKLAQIACNRYTGIGADGLIVVSLNPLRMTYYNADGSRAPMCGNGLRCFSQFVYDEKLVNSKIFQVLTDAYSYDIEIKDGLIKTNFPISFSPKLMDIATDLDKFFNIKLLDSICYAVYSGTSHLVTFVDDLNINEEYAKALHMHPIFKSKINVNFVKVLSRKQLKINTYERGVGFTKACGTGAIASFVIARLLNYVDDVVYVNYEVGNMLIEEVSGNIYQTAKASKIAKGILFLDE